MQTLETFTAFYLLFLCANHGCSCSDTVCLLSINMPLNQVVQYTLCRM